MLKTSAGQYSSEKLVVRTHKMTDLSGITVTPGVLPAPLRESLTGAVERIGGKIADGVRIDTTHFVCTEGRGLEWERAVEINIPVVRPEWVEGCEREGRIVGVRGYYLNADPRLRKVGQSVIQQQQSPVPQQRFSQPPHGSAESSPPPTPHARVPLQHSQTDAARLSKQQTPSLQPEPSPRHSGTLSNQDSGPPPPEKDTPQPSHLSSGESDEDSVGSVRTTIPQGKSAGQNLNRDLVAGSSRPVGLVNDQRMKDPEDETPFSDVQI